MEKYFAQELEKLALLNYPELESTEYPWESGSEYSSPISAFKGNYFSISPISLFHEDFHKLKYIQLKNCFLFLVLIMNAW